MTRYHDRRTKERAEESLIWPIFAFVCGVAWICAVAFVAWAAGPY